VRSFGAIPVPRWLGGWWLVDSLTKAHVAGLVEQSGDAFEAVVQPWVVMPVAVAEYVDLRRSEQGPEAT
jgi:hypothetical protein